jgi:5-methyltetrahydrofolate--homocysteine methyltransferase
MKSLLEKLRDGKVLVSDGAWGTFLHEKGLKPGDCPELWNITRRADVLDIALRYIEAGADMIETNSFGGSRFKLEHFGLADKTVELNREAAAISREAAGPDRFVLGSIGPTGKMLMMGETTEEELGEVFAEQAVALEQGGADACCIETFSAIDEAVCAVKAARENTRLEVICTFTFDRTVTGEYRTMMGVSPADMAAALVDAGAQIIGTNCGNGFERMIDIVKEIRAACPGMPVLVHANAGLPEVCDGHVRFPESPSYMAGMVPGLIRAGANIVGGCCGTTPAHIKEIRAAMRTNEAKRNLWHT